MVYKVMEKLSIRGGAGLAMLQQETKRLDEEGIDFRIDTNNPGFYISGGLTFRFFPFNRLFLSTSPEVSYISLRNMHAIDSDNDDDISEDYTLNQDMFLWKTPLQMGLDLGWLTPYLGGCYQGFRQHIDFDETLLEESEEGEVEEVVEKATVDREMYFRPCFAFTGLVGFSIPIGRGNLLSFEAEVGKGFSISSKLSLGL